MTDDPDGDGEAEDAARPRADPRIDRIEFVHEWTADDDHTVDGSASGSLPSVDTPTPRRAVVPAGAVEVRGGPVDPDRYAARYGADGGFTDELRRLHTHYPADRLTVVRLPGVRRINAYFLGTAPGDLAETVRQLDRQTTADAIATVGLGDHAIVRLTYYREDEPADASDAGEELLFPTGDDDLDRQLVDGDGADGGPA